MITMEFIVAIEIKFECNICKEIYYKKDGEKSIPIGWGAIRPTLRVSLPPYSELKTKKDQEAFWEFDELKDSLKRKLWDQEIHICHSCLRLNQNKILRIEE